MGKDRLEGRSQGAEEEAGRRCGDTVARRPRAKVKAANPVSPLAPAGGFPDLPVIAGVEFAAVEAGVRYANRTDVMLVRLAPGTAWPGPSPGRPPGRPACAIARPSWR